MPPEGDRLCPRCGQLIPAGQTDCPVCTRPQGFLWSLERETLVLLSIVVLAIFFTAGLNNTPFYPSKFDLQSSLTIHNASSSHYTLTAMSYVALAVPFVLAYIAYVWRAMDLRKMTENDLKGENAGKL